MIAPYRSIPSAERARTLAAYDDLLDAACAAREEGWRSHERDVLSSEARRLGLRIWPALLDRMTREATASHFTY